VTPLPCLRPLCVLICGRVQIYSLGANGHDRGRRPAANAEFSEITMKTTLANMLAAITIAAT
jgi:hypothetical protein